MATWFSSMMAARRAADLYAAARAAVDEGRTDDAVALQRAARQAHAVACKRRAIYAHNEKARQKMAADSEVSDARFRAMMVEKARKGQTGSVADWNEYVRFRAVVDPHGRFS